MKKKLLSVILASTMALGLVACGADAPEATSEAPAENSVQEAETEAPAQEAPAEEAADDSAASGEVIKITMWGAEEDQDLLRTLSDEFIEAHKNEAAIEIQIGVESESTAKDTVLADPEAAADVFAFADDQMKSLVDAGALQSIDDMAEVFTAVGKTIDDVKNANSSGSVSAASYNGKMYAFPMSGGNGFFLFYDSTKVSAEDVKSWDTLLEAANAAGGKVAMTLASGWYNAGFFVGAGFSAGEVDADGVTTVDWNGTSSKGITGVQVAQAMLTIAGNPAFQAVADGGLSDAIANGGLVAVVDGTWDAGAVQEAFGDGYAATILPTYTAGGNVCQQADYAGFKLVGVNPYSENVGWATLLAEYITNETSQAARYTARGSLPTNNVAASVPEIADDVALSAIMAQDAYGVPQTVGGNFWSPSATFGENIAQGTWGVDDVDNIQAALDELVAGINAPIGE